MRESYGSSLPRKLLRGSACDQSQRLTIAIRTSAITIAETTMLTKPRPIAHDGVSALRSLDDLSWRVEKWYRSCRLRRRPSLGFRPGRNPPVTDRRV